MNTEIELKYLVNTEQCAQIITDYLNEQNYTFEQVSQQLSNCYFDTPEQSLRKFDMGLRIRTRDNKHEQTIKTAGTVVGGLHQRPEYNVNVDDTFPQLSLFPDTIWLDGQDVAQTQRDLVPLFTTNFNRMTWTVILPSGSVIELAYDNGDITTGGKSELLCEIELELVKGQRDDLLLLAQALFSRLSLRPGIKSKAARGYALWLNQSNPYRFSPLELILLSGDESIEESFTAGLNYSLVRMQETIEAYVNHPTLALLAKAGEILALIRHGFWLYEQYLPTQALHIRKELSYYLQLFQWVDTASYIKELTNKTGNYSKKIELSEQLFQQLNIERKSFPKHEDVIEIIYGQRFNELQLNLLKLLLAMQTSNQKQNQNAQVSEQPYNQALYAFANNALNQVRASIFDGISSNQPLDCLGYLTEKKNVIRCLLTGSWFGSLYDKDARLEFRGPWLDIKQGISELETLWLLHEQLEKLAEAPQKLLLWQNGKLENLLIALDSSRTMAAGLVPYWEKV